MHVFGELVNISGKLVHIFAWKLVSRTSKQVSRNLGPLWQPGVYNDVNPCASSISASEVVRHPQQKMLHWQRMGKPSHLFFSIRLAGDTPLMLIDLHQRVGCLPRLLRWVERLAYVVCLCSG